MPEPKPPFFTRLALALQTFWHTLNDPGFAVQLARLSQGNPATPPETPQPTPATLKETLPDAALQLLALLQQEGRFVDFLQENVNTYSDAEIGGAARVVHEGCRKALQEHLTLAPVRSEEEGTHLTLQEGFDAAAIRLTGNVVGTAPFSGALVHRGWRVVDIKLPKIAEGHDVKILAPAEVEL
jgi:hypothetical protein